MLRCVGVKPASAVMCRGEPAKNPLRTVGINTMGSDRLEAERLRRTQGERGRHNSIEATPKTPDGKHVEQFPVLQF